MHVAFLHKNYYLASISSPVISHYRSICCHSPPKTENLHLKQTQNLLSIPNCPHVIAKFNIFSNVCAYFYEIILPSVISGITVSKCTRVPEHSWVTSSRLRRKAENTGHDDERWLASTDIILWYCTNLLGWTCNHLHCNVQLVAPLASAAYN